MEFYQKKCNMNQKVMLCPNCSSLFQKIASKAFEVFEKRKTFKEHKKKKEAQRKWPAP